jgi:hypothetical protein
LWLLLVIATSWISVAYVVSICEMADGPILK